MRIKNFWFLISITLFLSLSSSAQEPERAMVLVFDQMRPDYIERFDLPNFKRAQDLGLNFDNGIVGHLESNTIISHPVITHGKLPKNMPWASQAFRDSTGTMGPPGHFYTPFYFTQNQWFGLLQEFCGESSLVAQIKSKNPGPAFAVAQKEYAACNFGGTYADTIVALGEPLKSGPFKGHHSIAGVNVPSYVSKPLGNRFYLEGTNSWGSGGELYPLKGSGYVTGDDPDRPGGDAWVGDVVEKIMANEPDWSIILASFGSVDKISHCLAEHDAPTKSEWALRHGVGLEDTLRKADRELGRILDRLQEQGKLDNTIIVITADHGGQFARHYQGRNRVGKHRHDSYYGQGANYSFMEDPHPAIVPLIETGKLQAATMHTMQLFWTHSMTADEKKNFVRLISEIPSISEVFQKVKEGQEYRYESVFQSPKLKGRELSWAQKHSEDLANTMCNVSAPEFLATLRDGYGYSLIGSHGGAQELVQRIPMIVISPNLVRAGSHSKAWVRLVDVNPMIGEAMGLQPRSDLDGTSKHLAPFLEPKR